MKEGIKVEVEDDEEKTDVDYTDKGKKSDSNKEDPAAKKPVDTKDKKKKDPKLTDEDEIEEATDDEEEKFHKDLDKLVHKTFGQRDGEVEVDEVCGTKKMKKESVLKTLKDSMISESSARDYVDNRIAAVLKKAGISAKVKKEIGYTKYTLPSGQTITNDGQTVDVKKAGKTVKSFFKPKLQVGRELGDVVESTQLVEFMKFDAQDAIKDFSGKVAKIKSNQSVNATVMPVRGNSWDTDNGYVPVLKNFSRKGKMTKIDLKAGQEVAIDTKRGNVYGMVGDKFFYTSTGNVDLKEGVEIAEAKEHPAYQPMMDLAKKLNDRDTRAIQVLAGKIANFTATGNRGNMKDMAKALKSLDAKNQAAVVKILNKTDSALAKSINYKMAGMKESLEEDHFKVGDTVKCKASGMKGKVVKVDDEEKGAYYSVEREDGKVTKYEPDQLIKEASGDKEAYQKFFQSALKKFGVKSPSELDGDKEKSFYDYIDKNWEGDNEKEEVDESTISEAKFTDKQIKQAYGILNDKRWKSGNMTHIVNTIEKIAKGLSKHPGVAKAIQATNESVERPYKSNALNSIVNKLKGE